MELQVIQNKIYEIRGNKVMLDFDLAEMYGVETRVLNQAVNRNIKRFPLDFMFQLTNQEFANLKSQIVISSWGGTRKLPFVFTEHGVTMLSSVLRSGKAIEINIQIVRAFIAMRNFILDNKSQSKEIEELRSRVNLLEESNESTLKAINDLSEDTNNNFDDIYLALSELAERKKSEEKPRNPIGFKK